ncbi:hypothetical protein ACFP1L_00205 [Lactiplantibacillus nangangensis]|uniref:Uncharacterized protein n=1 Tax=Lactiplantibacillus nangangensis TaxID=2559917 RepID=A0ABW1SF65_9LACO|nr:hypothetical protein [Lactiplantibacillus nangangensis]
MRVIIRRHKLISISVIIALLLVGAISGIWATSAYKRYQAQRVMEKVLKQQGYPADTRYERVSFKLTGNELFSGVGYYEYGFSNQKTLTVSHKYFNYLHKTSNHLTVKNSPIIYRVAVFPPTAKVNKWTARLYLDSIDSPNGIDHYIEKLNASSDQEIQSIR